MSISWTSMMLAAQLGRLSVYKLLIQNGVKPTLSFCAKGHSPLIAAISSGDYNTVKFLVNNRGSRLKTVLVPIDYKEHKAYLIRSQLVQLDEKHGSEFHPTSRKSMWEDLRSVTVKIHTWNKFPSQNESKQFSDSRHLSWPDQERVLLMHISANYTNFRHFPQSEHLLLDSPSLGWLRYLYTLQWPPLCVLKLEMTYFYNIVLLERRNFPVSL